MALRASDCGTVLTLAVVNGAGAIVFLAWLVAEDGFSAPAVGLLVAVSVGLAGLAVAEAATLQADGSASRRI